MSKVEITEIKIRLGEKEIILTPQEAEGLYNTLGEIYEKKIEIVRSKEYIPYPQYPYIWYAGTVEDKWRYGNYEVYCDNNCLTISNSY